MISNKMFEQYLEFVKHKIWLEYNKIKSMIVRNLLLLSRNGIIMRNIM